MAGEIIQNRTLLRALTVVALFFSLTFMPGKAFSAQTFEEGLSLYHQGNDEAAFNVFRDLHQSHPTGSGKLQYFMALSAYKLHRDHDALRYLDGAIQTNPSLSFAKNRAHVENLRQRLIHETKPFSPDSPLASSTPMASALTPMAESPHSGHSVLIISMVVVFAIALLIFVAGRMGERRKTESQIQLKQGMEETGSRLIKAVDKLQEEKSYYLLDHPEQKEALSRAFSALDPAYVRVLTIMKEPDTPGTDWEDRNRRFEAALAPVDQAISQIREIMEPGATSAPSPEAPRELPTVNLHPNGDNQPLTGGSDPSKCIFDGADATNGRTISLERDGKVAFVRVCPKCLSEMETNYQRTGAYAPPQSALGGGMPFMGMGGGMGFGDLMLMDWMMHSFDRPEYNSGMMPQGDGGWGGGGFNDREDRSGSIGEGSDRS